MITLNLMATKVVFFNVYILYKCIQIHIYYTNIHKIKKNYVSQK